MTSNNEQMVEECGPIAWDKTTFRVSRVPWRLDLRGLPLLLANVLNLAVSEVEVHSLASDVSNPNETPWKTATVAFRTRPARLQASQSDKNEWIIEVPSPSDDKSEREALCFDTHFEGFTPLSPSENDDEHEVDCIMIPGWGGHALGSFRSTTSSYVWLRDSLPRHCPQATDMDIRISIKSDRRKIKRGRF